MSDLARSSESLRGWISLGNTPQPWQGLRNWKCCLDRLALFAAFKTSAGLEAQDLSLTEPMVVIGLPMVQPFPSGRAMTMKSVGRAAEDMITEIRPQFKEIDGLLEGREGSSQTAQLVLTSRQRQLSEMVLPGVVAVKPSDWCIAW
ncbi:MAG: hypothetical protein Ct9H90mP16_18930 [Candidatus Poseidoniales archaeon]|nr:MAG: hypothetical protein Ct9H90mP16_18930 [Candidatus Poseidoniales archaeon]